MSKKPSVASGNITAMEAEWIRQIQTQGWADATEEQVCLVDGLFNTPLNEQFRYATLEEIQPTLRTVPSSLTKTLLADAVLDSVALAGQHSEEGYTGVTRLLVSPRLGRVVFSENEYVLTGERTHIHCENLRPRINGKPMVYSVCKAPSGKAQTSFFWSTEQKEFQLYLEIGVLKDSQLYSDIFNNLLGVTT